MTKMMNTLPDHLDEEDALPESGGSLPVRPKRRLLTPLTGALSAITLAAVAFYGGVEVQKRQGSDGAVTAAGGVAQRAGGFPGAGGPRAGAAGAGGQGAGARAAAPGGDVTAGTVSSKSGSTLYVKTSDGTVVRVKAGDTATITRNAAASAKGIYPGDSVVVQGKTATSGTVTASQVTAVASSAAGTGRAARGAGGGTATGG